MQHQRNHITNGPALHPTELLFPSHDERYQQLPLSKPGPDDVLCGKGNGTKHHPGNVTYRNIVARYKSRCVMAQKFDKPMFARQVVFDVRHQYGGLFLKKGEPEKGEDPSMYYDIGDEAAVKKAAQALREDAEKLRKEIFEKMGIPDKASMEKWAQSDGEVPIKDGMDTISLIYPLSPNILEHDGKELQTTPDAAMKPDLINTEPSFNRHSLISRDSFSQESIMLAKHKVSLKDNKTNCSNQQTSRGIFNDISVSTLGDSSGETFPVEDNSRIQSRLSINNVFDSENTNNEKHNFSNDFYDDRDIVNSLTNPFISGVSKGSQSYLNKSLQYIEENDETGSAVIEDFPMDFNHRLSIIKMTDEYNEGDGLIDNLEESTDVSPLIRERSANSVFLNPPKRTRLGSICSSKMDALQLEIPIENSPHMCDIRNTSSIVDILHLEIPQYSSFRMSDMSRFSSNSLIRSHESYGSMHNSINGYSNTADIRKSVANFIARERGKVKDIIGTEENFGRNYSYEESTHVFDT